MKTIGLTSYIESDKELSVFRRSVSTVCLTIYFIIIQAAILLIVIYNTGEYITLIIITIMFIWFTLFGIPSINNLIRRGGGDKKYTHFTLDKYEQQIRVAGCGDPLEVHRIQCLSVQSQWKRWSPQGGWAYISELYAEIDGNELAPKVLLLNGNVLTVSRIAKKLSVVINRPIRWC